MYSINEKQIDFILNDIHARGINIESLQRDLLDHICIIIEQTLEKEEDFEECYLQVIRTFYRKELHELEEETIFLLTCKNHIALSRNWFFLLLFTIFIGPFIGYDIVWLANSGQTTGWNIPIYIWGASMVYSIFPLLILLVLFFTPDRLDPLIPSNSTILLGIDPFIKIIPNQINRVETRLVTF
jgi:hypothetical protein